MGDNVSTKQKRGSPAKDFSIQKISGFFPVRGREGKVIGSRRLIVKRNWQKVNICGKVKSC